MKKLYLIWISVILISSLLAPRFLSYDPSFPYSAELLASSGLPQFIYSFANFDGVHYLTIINKGYIGTGLIQAFFPAYPFLIFLISQALPISNIILGISISLISTYLAARLISQLYSKAEVNKNLLYLSLFTFPTSFFLAAMYSEGFFLMLVLTTFLMANKKKWLFAALLAAVASATRIVGILLVPALIIELWDQKNHELTIQQIKDFLVSNIKTIFLISLGSLGLLVYMLYLNNNFSDPLYFIHVQEEFGVGRSESFVSYPQVIYRYLKILLTARPFDLKYYSYVLELISAVLPLGLLVVFYKKIRKSHLFFSVMAILIPTMTGTFTSLPRYVLVAFPIYFLLAQIFEKSKYRIPYFVISTILLIINVVLFVQGYWVA